MAMGGVGEAMLLGAAMGGGTSALMGRDPLKGALIGGLTGGAGAGIGTALSGAAPVVEGAALSGAGGASLGGAGLGGAGMAGTGGGLSATAGSSGLGANLGSSLSGSSLGSGLSGSGLGAGANYSLAAGQGLNTATSLGASNAGITSALPSSTAGMTGSGLGTGTNYSLTAANSAPASGGTFTEGMSKFANDPIASIGRNKGTAAMASLAAMRGTTPDPYMPEEYDGPLKRMNWENYRPAYGYAEGGITALASGGYDRMVGEEPMYQAMARGGISDLGGYSDYARGGRMLKGPGDGMSDNIPATIAGKRPARLADGEFVMPADVVSHLGNGSTDAGAKQLYAMMDRVRKARTGRKSQGREISAQKYMAA